MRRLQHRPGAAAGARLHGRHRRPVPDPGALPAGDGLPVPPPPRLPRHRSRPHPAAGRLDGRLRHRQPDRLHGRGPARLQRHRAGPARGQLRRPRGVPRRPGHRPDHLRQLVPDDDGPARHRHRLAGDSGAAPAGGSGRRHRPRRDGPDPRRDPAHRPGRRASLRGAAADHRARPGQRALRSRGRPGQLRAVPTGARAVRPRAGPVHRALPDAARLLRPGAQQDGVPHPVRRRHRERRGGDRPGHPHRPAGHGARPW